MAEWCWIGMGLFCLAVGAAVALLALVIWFIAWLLRFGRRVAPVAPPAPVEYEPPAPVAETKPTVPQPLEPELETSAEQPGTAPLDGPFVTYESRRAGHLTVHRRGCWAIEKKSGGHRHGVGLYVGHDSYEAAKLYAHGTGLDVRECGLCKPGGAT